MMASIPCGTYQASHIHAHMRRQRARHLSANSTDSAASDSCTQATPIITLPNTSTQVTGPVTVKERMERVYQWIGDGVKRLRHPFEESPANRLTRLSDGSIGSVSMASQTSAIHSDSS